MKFLTNWKTYALCALGALYTALQALSGTLNEEQAVFVFIAIGTIASLRNAVQKMQNAQATAKK